MQVASNISCIFNKVYLNLMKEIKDKDTGIKSKLKSNYKVFDKKSDEYIKRLCIHMDSSVSKSLFDLEEDITDRIEILNMELYVDLTVDEIMKKIVNNDTGSKNSFKYYLYILLLFCYIYKIDDLEDDKKYILMCKTVEILNSLDTKKIQSTEDLEKHLEDIIDDDLKLLLKRVYDDRMMVNESVMKLDMNDFDSSLDFLNNTKIGELAKEISSTIDLSKLGGANADDMLDLNNLMSGSNNVLGEIIQTVGTKITEKIQSGQLNQDMLMNEAMNMMGNLNSSGHGDMMTQMMGMMSQMGNMMGNMNHQQKDTNKKTRERLQRKIANKKVVDK